MFMHHVWRYKFLRMTPKFDSDHNDACVIKKAVFTYRVVEKYASVRDILKYDDTANYLWYNVCWRHDLYQIVLLCIVQRSPLPVM
jgi:hypothetical protein